MALPQRHVHLFVYLLCSLRLRERLSYVASQFMALDEGIPESQAQMLLVAFQLLQLPGNILVNGPLVAAEVPVHLRLRVHAKLEFYRPASELVRGPPFQFPLI